MRGGGGLRFGFGLLDEDGVVRPVPGRDLVPPPELARNAPGLDVLKPVEIGLFPVLGHELGLAAAYGFKRRLGQRLGVDIPLVGQPGLDDDARAVAMRHDMRVGLDLVEQPALFHHCDDALARSEAVDPVQRQNRVEVGGWREPGQERFVADKIELRLSVEDVDQRQLVPLANLEIVEIMRGRDFHRAGSLLRVRISSATIGMRRPASGRTTILPTRSA